jgi:hypothetical protein
MLQRIALVFVLLLSIGVMRTDASLPPAPPAPLPQQAPEIASYRMDVTLDPAAKTVAGTAQIRYRNPSEDTLPEVWLRLYLKAFSSPETTWMRESNGGMRGFDFDPSNPSDITIHSLTLNDGTDLLANSTLTDTLLLVPLPRSLEPNQVLEMEVNWTSKLPRVFARTGYGGRNDTFFMVGQWYPKMAVYDRGRWDTEPWHANSEFFNDFGRYDVNITAPAEYVVAGAGVPTDETTNADGTKTHSFTSTNVTDFAFAASPDFLQANTKAGNVDVVLYYLPEHTSAVDEYLTSAAGSLEAYSAWFGAYPHARLTVIDVPDNAGGAGGMEYPTLITGGTIGGPINSGIIGLVTAHEAAHQWWPMQTATNEGYAPWLDEGLTEYSSLRYMLEANHRIGFGDLSINALSYDKMQYSLAPNEPVDRPAWTYDDIGYGGAVYSKTAIGLLMLERIVGTERMHAAMASYLEEYRFAHPTAEDFRGVMERELGDLSWLFDGFFGGGTTIDYAIHAITTNANESSVTVLREGTLSVPVDITITLASGTQHQRTWDGSDPSITYSFPASDPIVRAEADPERKLVAELDIADNGISAQPETAAMSLGARLLLLVQLLAQSFGLFG